MITQWTKFYYYGFKFYRLHTASNINANGFNNLKRVTTKLLETQFSNSKENAPYVLGFGFIANNEDNANVLWVIVENTAIRECNVKHDVINIIM